MKKKCLECVVLLLFIFALTHGIIQNTQPLKETKEVQTEYEEKTSQVTEKSQETEPEVQDLENQILRTASGKFFQKYPVDEAFMGWIETKYGSGVLQSLYTQLENGNQDPDLWYRFTGNSMHVLWLMYCRQQQYMSYSYEDLVGRAGHRTHLHQPRAPLDEDQLHALLPVECHLRKISRNGAGIQIEGEPHGTVLLGFLQ